MKTILKLLVVLLLAAGAFVAWVFFTLDPEELGQKILTMINEKTGVEMTAEKFEVRPLQGVDMENGRFQGDLDSGTASGTVDRMILDYKLLPLLKGEVVVHQILIESPDLEMVSRPVEEGSQPEMPEDPEPAEETAEGAAEGDEASAGQEESGFVSAISISEIRVVDGNLKVTSEASDAGTLSVQGLDFELGDLSMDAAATSPALGFAARGGIRIDLITLDDLSILGGRGDMVVDHGRLAVSDLGIETPHANLVVAEIAADITQDPAPYRLQAGGSYNLDSLVEAEEGGFGPASLEFAAKGAGPDIHDMVAEGTFRLESGQIPAFPMMVKIEKLLGKSVLVGFPYEGADIVFSITDGRAVVEPFVMGFENLQMAGGGVIDLSGPIDMQIDIRLPRESVSSSVLDPFIDGMTDEDGWTTVPFNIGGTMGEPDVSFDMTSIKSTAVDMGKRAVTNALDDALGDLKEKTFRRRQKTDDG